MKNSLSIDGTDLIVHMPEEVDHLSSADLRIAADLILENYNIHRIIFDFSNTLFMDSSGIALILRAQQRMQLLEGSILVCNVPPQARRVLDAAGIGRLVTIR